MSERPDHVDEIPSGARQVSVGFDRLGRWIDGFVSRHGGMSAIRTPQSVQLNGADGERAWITVPFPPLRLPAPPLDPALDYDPLADLIEHAQRPRRIAVVLVRRGGHASGVFDGETLLASKVGTAYVQGTTRAGGWSQQRYARRRANQSRAAFEDAADEAVRVVLPYLDSIDAVIVGGDHGAVDATLSDVRLAPLRPLVRLPFLAVPDPRLRVLQSTPALFRTVRIDLVP
jgi:hypothetical protein